MNICIVTSSFPAHADDLVQAPFAVDFVRALQARGHRVFVFTQDRAGRREEFLPGVKICWYSWWVAPKPLVALNPLHPMELMRMFSLLFGGARALPHFVAAERIDVCFALWIVPSGLFANRALHRTGVPYAIWSLGSDMWRYGRKRALFALTNKILREARAVFADGFGLAREIEERFGIKCGFLATTRVLERPAAVAPRADKGRHTFLFVGRLNRDKGIDVLLEAFALLAAETSAACLEIAGDGPLAEWAKAFVDKRGLAGSVSLLGMVSNEQLAERYAAADCVVIPSRADSIPLVFSEALAFGRKLVVTDVGDMGYLGRTYGAAAVVPPEDPERMKESLKEQVLQRGSVEPSDSGLRDELLRLFDITVSADRFLEAFNAADAVPTS